MLDFEDPCNEDPLLAGAELCPDSWKANTVDQDVTISSDFSWVFDSNATTAGLQPAVGVFNLPNCDDDTEVFSSTEISATCLFGDSAVDIDVSDNVSGGARAILPATSFVSEHVLNYEGSGEVDGSITVANVVLGAWTLNGFQAKVAYMPFQQGIGQVIYIANRSDQTGAITVDWIDKDGSKGSCDIGAVNAGSTRAIGPAINACLPAAQQQGGRLALVITANVPACDAQLNAQYNVSGDRAFSVSSTNCD